MIFAIIVLLTDGLTNPDKIQKLSLLHPPFLLGLIAGGSVIYWFTGASMQAVTHGRLPRGRVHQGEHQARRRREGVDRRQQEGRRDLHDLRAEGDVQHLPRRLLRHARLRLPRPVLLHRLPHLDRALRPLPGALHGERRRRLGQREEDRRGRAQAEGHAAPRRVRRRRHRRRSIQGHEQRRDEPDHQVHDALRPPRRRAGERRGPPDRPRDDGRRRRRLLRDHARTSCGAASTGCASTRASSRWPGAPPRPTRTRQSSARSLSVSYRAGAGCGAARLLRGGARIRGPNGGPSREA